MTTAETPTVPPPPSQCCPRCAREFVAVPCPCDPVPVARRAFADLHRALRRMTLTEVRHFRAWAADWLARGVARAG